MAHDLVVEDPRGADAVRRGRDLKEAHNELMSRLGRDKAAAQARARAARSLADKVRTEEVALEAGPPSGGDGLLEPPDRRDGRPMCIGAHVWLTQCALMRILPRSGQSRRSRGAEG